METEEMTIKELTKEVITEGIITYPELAAYEAFLKYHAELYLSPENCSFMACLPFGIAVIPDVFNIKIHTGLKLTKIVGGARGKSVEYLSHQIYLHNLVKAKWEAEKEGNSIEFEIECVRKEPEYVIFK